MIETCSRKRMVLGITFLGLLTILVLFVESHWTATKGTNTRKHFIVEQNSSCGEHEKFETVKDCEPCSAFEIASGSIGVCIHTHYKEVLKCASGGTVLRSCDRAAYYDERAFWHFEGIMFVASSLSMLCLLLRKRVLNKRMLQRVQRQLANSV